jgi:pilus assembly protein CpaC
MTIGMKNIYRFVRLSLSGLAISVVVAQSGPEDLRLTVGKSIVIDYPDDISRISTSNADIVDASPVTAREILIHGKSFGTVTLVVWSKAGQRNFYNLTVEQNLEPLRKLLRDTFPQEDIHVQSSRDSLALTGHISGKDAAERAIALATPFGKTVVNNLQVAAAPVEKQILLRVKFVELDRSKETQLAVNLISTGAGNTIARTTTGQFPAPSASTVTGVIGGAAQGTSTSFSLSDALNLFAFNPRLNLGALIKALQSKAVLQILAEPNLVTTSGKEASFVVGGEFPVPVLQGGRELRSGHRSVSRIRRKTQVHASSNGKQNNSHACHSGSLLARLCQRGHIERLHHPRLVHPQNRQRHRVE